MLYICASGLALLQVSAFLCPWLHFCEDKYYSYNHNDLLLTHRPAPLLFRYYTHNNKIYGGILTTSARSKALTQHISWQHCDLNGDHLTPLGNYMDNTWAPLGNYITPLENRPDICHFFSTNVLLGSIFLHMKLYIFCIYGNVFYITHMPYVENFRFFRICHVETSDISPHMEKFSISPQLSYMKS